MQYSAPALSGLESLLEYDFEIGDRVYLLTNPRWLGVVAARSISVYINVLWDDYGIEQIDRRLLRLATAYC